MTDTRTVSRLPAPERREQLLETALHVIARQGFHQTSMDDVAKKAGVTKPVLYQHFESKQEMYFLVLRETIDQLQNSIDSRRESSSNVLEWTELGILGVFKFFEDIPDAFNFLLGASDIQEAELRHELRKLQDNLTIRMARNMQSLDLEKSVATASGAFGLLVGVLRHWMNDGQRTSVEDMAHLTSKMLTHGLMGVIEEFSQDS